MENKEKLLIWLKEFQEKLNAFDLALGTISFDDETVAPSAGADYRNKAFALLAGEIFIYKTSDIAFNNLKKLQSCKLDETTKRIVDIYIKSIEKTKCIPKKMYVEFVKLQKESTQIWRKAKKDNNYNLYKPYLLKIIEMTKKIYACRKSKMPLYDQMLDDFEEGMDMKKYDAFFELLKAKIVPLIKKINSAKKIDDKFLNQKFAIDSQKNFNNVLLEYLDFKKENGYMATSSHPFTMELSIGDVRITTRYNETQLSENIFSVIHEIGHAFFQQQIDKKFEGTPITCAIGSGMHESQSRLLENQIGRSIEFWKPLYKKLQNHFPKQLEKVNLEKFINAINISIPSFIRTEADELTYSIHIIIRYELEKEIFNGKININNLNKVWNEKYKKYLGITPPTDTLGILQDIHWSDGSFGYFPAYALGSAMAAQWINTMRKKINVNNLLSSGKFIEIKKWLKNNIHQYGALYTSIQLLKKVTNEEFNPKYYVDYLIKKFSSLYKIKI